MGIEDGEFAEFYKELYPRVIAFALHRVPSDDARDTVDEAFLIAWRKRGQLTSDALLPWLFVTVRNIISNNRRRNRSRDALTEELGHLVGDFASGTVESHVIERMTVLDALNSLTEREREALILMAWDGLDTRTAARVVGCSTAAFAVRVHRARRRLADALARIDSQLEISSEISRPIRTQFVATGERKGI